MEKFQTIEFDYLTSKINCSMSVGISLYKEGWSSNEWLKSADNAAYRAKQSGKNRQETAE